MDMKGCMLYYCKGVAVLSFWFVVDALCWTLQLARVTKAKHLCKFKLP